VAKMMTKKHYQLFAETISKVKKEEERNQIFSFLFPILKRDNPRFNEDTFKEFVKRRLNNEELKGLKCNPKYLK